MKPIIILRDVSKFYGNKCALKNINLTISEGDFVFIFGEIGAGKTTLLRIISGEMKPTKGKAIILGNQLTPQSTFIKLFKIRRLVSFIPQEPRLIFSKTVSENVFIRNGLEREERDRILTMLKLMEVRDEKVKNLSGGYIRLTSIARGIAQNLNLIVADEPTANLSPEISIEIIKTMKEMNRIRNTTFIVATHNYDIVTTIKDTKIIRMEKGEIKEIIYG